MNNQEIVGMNSAYKHAKQCSYGANMSISAALIVEMVERIAELEKFKDYYQELVEARGYYGITDLLVADTKHKERIAELKKGISHMLTLSRNGQEFPSHLDKLAKLLEQGE